MSYLLNKKSNIFKRLENYEFKSEGRHKISPQEILANHPEIITDMPELELNTQNIPLVKREFSFERKPIDILYVTNEADIILVETKLLRNSESHRLVVAQVIDYVKTLVKVDTSYLIDEMIKSKYSESSFKSDDFFLTTLAKNLSTGNFKVVITGDKIHPNILEMVDSIQSVPHLSFTIYLVELSPIELDDDNIILKPKVISQTIEIERSVIKLQITKQGEIEIDSEIPNKEGKGSKPIITENEYLNNLSKPELAPAILRFWRNWKELGGDIRFGSVGFSSGVKVEGKRKAIQFAYQSNVTLISEKSRLKFGISDQTYELYIEHIKQNLPRIYDKYIVGNLVAVPFNLLSEMELSNIFEAVFIILKNEYKIY